MELFHNIPHIDFMGMRRKTATVSILLFIISIGFLSVKGLNFGLDFTGGTQIEVRYDTPQMPDHIKSMLQKQGFEAKVAQFGSANDILIRMPNHKGMSEEQLNTKVVNILKASNDPFSVRRVEFVGSEVGENMAEQGGMAVIVALLATMLYIAIRFEYRFAVSAAVALIHDPILILGVFSAFQIEFDLATLGALLAVIGYSLNDTIVIYDRVRENFRRVRKGTSLEIMNLSINQTLSRTIMTSVLTLLSVIALFFFGGETLFGLSTALIIGIIVGTYSSIYVAGALAVALGLSKSDLMVVRKEIEDSP